MQTFIKKTSLRAIMLDKKRFIEASLDDRF